MARRGYPPDFVVLAHRDHTEFGVGPFGVDPRKSRRLVGWITAHYRLLVGSGRSHFGVAALVS